MIHNAKGIKDLLFRILTVNFPYVRYECLSGSEGVTPRIFKLGTTSRLEFSLTLRPLYPGEKVLGHIGGG